MIRKTVHLFIILVLGGFLFALSGEWCKSQTLAQIPPHIFYVAPNGSDTNDGSLNDPWATLNHAAKVLKAGETVYIRAGTYRLTDLNSRIYLINIPSLVTFMDKLDLTNDDTTRLELKTKLLQQIESLDDQQALFPSAHESIDELVQNLEKMNPIPQPLQPDYLSYLVGEWQLVYASRGTVVTRQVASISNWGEYIKIERVWQELALNSNDKIVAVNAAILDLPLFGKWQIQANGIWSWDIPEQTAKVSFSSFSIQAKQPLIWSNWSLPELTIPVLQWMRSEAIWITSYLDSEIRVGRGATGNLFVFRRIC